MRPPKNVIREALLSSRHFYREVYTGPMNLITAEITRINRALEALDQLDQEEARERDLHEPPEPDDHQYGWETAPDIGYLPDYDPRG